MPDNAVARENLDELICRLKYGNRDEQREAITQLLAYGSEALQVMPELDALYRAHRIHLAAIEVIEFYQKTSYRPLLNAFLADIPLVQLSCDELCALPSDVPGLEEYLCNELYNVYRDQTNDYERRKIVATLAEAGGVESLKLLNTIKLEFSDKVPEKTAEVQRAENEGPSDEVLESFERARLDGGSFDATKLPPLNELWRASNLGPKQALEKDRNFLELVRHGIKRIQGREYS